MNQNEYLSICRMTPQKSQSIDFVRSMLWLYELEIRDFSEQMYCYSIVPSMVRRTISVSALLRTVMVFWK